MEIQVQNYYDLSKFSNTFYLIQIAIEKYFANNVFRSDLTRVIYASEQFAFRQRLNLLAKGGSASVKELQLPFMSYFRKGNWEIDTRAAVQNATAALSGFPESTIGGQLLRFLQVKTTFSCFAFFNSDADAQLGYESLLWIQQPAPKQFPFSSMDYLGSTFDIPIHLAIENLEFNPDTTEKDWLVKNRVVPVRFDLVIKSVAFAQKPQTPEANVFFDQAPPVITEKVILDYLSYKYENSYYDAQHIDFEVTGTLNPDPSLNGSLTIDFVDNTSIRVRWDYDPAVDDLYTDNIRLSLNGYTEVEVARNLRVYTFTDLEPESLYNITIWFFSKKDQITKYIASTTTSTGTTMRLKGMVGYN